MVTRKHIEGWHGYIIQLVEETPDWPAEPVPARISYAVCTARRIVVDGLKSIEQARDAIEQLAVEHVGEPDVSPARPAPRVSQKAVRQGKKAPRQGKKTPQRQAGKRGKRR